MPQTRLRQRSVAAALAAFLVLAGAACTGGSEAASEPEPAGTATDEEIAFDARLVASDIPGFEVDPDADDSDGGDPSSAAEDCPTDGPALEADHAEVLEALDEAPTADTEFVSATSLESEPGVRVATIDNAVTILPDVSLAQAAMALVEDPRLISCTTETLATTEELAGLTASPVTAAPVDVGDQATSLHLQLSGDVAGQPAAMGMLMVFVRVDRGLAWFRMTIVEVPATDARAFTADELLDRRAVDAVVGRLGEGLQDA